jgi:hypothetical protein
MFDENGNDVPLALDFNNLSATLHEDYVGMNTAPILPGFDSSMSEKPQVPSIGVKKICLYLGLCGYHPNDLGKSLNRCHWKLL